MLALTVSDIKEYVKARLDELSNNEDAGLVTGDQAVEDLDKIIEAVIVPSVRKIHLDAPNVLLTEGVIMANVTPTLFERLDETGTGMAGEGSIYGSSVTITFGEGGGQFLLNLTSSGPWVIIGANRGPSPKPHYAAHLALPTDFMRLINVRMSDWRRPVQTLLEEDSAEYRKQQNPYLRGTSLRPAAAVLHNGADYDVQAFSCDSKNATATYMYVPEPEIETGQNVDYILICPKLKGPCLDQITAETLRSLGSEQAAVTFEAMATRRFMNYPDYIRRNPYAGERINITQRQQ